MRNMLPGVGVFGNTPSMRCYIPILKSCGLEVVALWTRTIEEGKHMSEELSIPLYTTDVDKVLLDRRVDLVVISCCPHIQAHIAAKALGIGKHVLCSPPSGPRSRDTLPMVHASRYYPRLMSLMCNGMRFLPSVMKMRTLILESGFVGDVTVCEVNVRYSCSSRSQRFGVRGTGEGVALSANAGINSSLSAPLMTAYDWTCDETMGGGVLNLYGGMVVDILTHLTGMRASKVQGMVRTFVRRTEKVSGIREITSDDFCSFQMEMGDKGACATITLNSQVPGPFMQEITVLGTLGRLTLRGADLYGQRHDKAKEDLLHFDPPGLREMEALSGSSTGAAGITSVNSNKAGGHLNDERAGPGEGEAVAGSTQAAQAVGTTINNTQNASGAPSLMLIASSSTGSGGVSVQPTFTSLSAPMVTSSSVLNTTSSSLANNSSLLQPSMPAPYLKGVVHMLSSVRDAFQQVEEKQGWCPDPVAQAATFEDCFYVQTVLDAVHQASRTRQSMKVVMTDVEPEPNPFLSTAMRRSTFSLH